MSQVDSRIVAAANAAAPRMEISPRAQTFLDAQISEADAYLAELREVLGGVNRGEFRAGDICVKLKDRCGSTLAWIAQQVDRSESTLSNYYITALEYPPGVRDESQPFYRHFLVAAACRRVEQRVRKSTGKTYHVNRREALAKCKNLKRPNDIIRLLREEARTKRQPETVVEAAAITAASGELLNSFQLCD